MAITGAVGAALRQEAPYQAEIQMGAQLILDFQGARSGGRSYYWYRGTRYTRPEKIPGWSFARASAGYAEDSAGNLIAFPANEPRITDKGLLIEEARTNSLRASDPTSAVLGVLGSGGALPLGWYQSTLAGIAYTVVAKGVDRGIPYVDLRISGTNTSGAGASVGVTMESTTAIVAAQGQNWAGSFYMQVVGEDLTGITSPSIVIFEWTAAGAFLANGLYPFVPTAALQRASYVRTLTNAATARTNLGFTGVVSNGASVDVTLRIGLPQLELGNFITSPIVTTGAAATRAADRASIFGLDAILGQFRTNYVPWSNPSNSVVGTPGAVPPGWNWSSAIAGLTTSVVGTGLENGYPFVDVRLAGTATASGQSDLGTTASAAAPATQGQAWTSSAYLRLVAGDAAGITMSALTYERNSSSAILGATANYVPLSSSVFRVSSTRTMVSTETAYTNMKLSFAGFVSGQAYDLTIRIYAPQLERAAVATDPIITVGSIASTGIPFTMVAWADMAVTQDGAIRTYVTAHTGLSTPRTVLYRGSGNVVQYSSVLNGVTTTKQLTGVYTGVRTVKSAVLVRSNEFVGAVDGTLSSTTAAPAPGIMDRLSIGFEYNGAAPLNGYVQRVVVLGDVSDAQLTRLTA